MKLFHVHAKSTVDVRLPETALKKLPKRLGIVTTIQHLHKIDDVVEQTKGVLAGQVLGCNASQAVKVNKNVDAFLFVGSGEFHPINVALKTGKKVWLWNPVSKNFGLLDEKLIDAIYSIVTSKTSDVKLRSAAAAAYGALDLPSRKVKDLILDQAGS